MGRVILCMGRTANIPFLLKKLGVQIYSVEELCYCIREHTFLMDEETACKELADWLGEECDLPDLAQQLHALLKKKAAADSFLTTVLEYTGYYPKEEIQRLSRFLNADNERSEYERRKTIGDYLAGNGKYELAMEQYRRLLADGITDKAFSAKVLHNMGYVSSRLFLFEWAAELFYQAYVLSEEKESLVQYLAAKRLLLEEKEYVDFIIANHEECYEASMELERRVEQAADAWEESGQAKQLADLLAERSEHPENSRRIWEDAAKQMKKACGNMIREK